MAADLYIVATIVVPQKDRDEFLAVAKGLVKGSNAEDGNNFYILTESNDTPNTFVVVEHWKSQEAIDFHNNTPHFQGFAKMVQEKNFQLTINIMKPVAL